MTPRRRRAACGRTRPRRGRRSGSTSSRLASRSTKRVKALSDGTAAASSGVSVGDTASKSAASTASAMRVRQRAEWRQHFESDADEAGGARAQGGRGRVHAKEALLDWKWLATAAVELVEEARKAVHDGTERMLRIAGQLGQALHIRRGRAGEDARQPSRRRLRVDAGGAHDEDAAKIKCDGVALLQCILRRELKRCARRGRHASALAEAIACRWLNAA